MGVRETAFVPSLPEPVAATGGAAAANPGVRPGAGAHKGTRRYRYYVCSAAQKRGWQNCPAPSVPAGPVEQLVVEQIQQLGPTGAWDNFASLWQALAPSEQARVIRLLVARLDYDGAQGKITITFHPNGSEILRHELAIFTKAARIILRLA